MTISGLPPSPFDTYIGQLHTLSSFPPQTFFYLNSDGHFVSTDSPPNDKKKLSEDTAEQITKFIENFLYILDASALAAINSREAKSIKTEFRKHIFICRCINFAINGRVKGGGLGGALDTYKNYGNSGAKIKSAIIEMRETAYKVLQILRNTLPEKQRISNRELVTMTTYSYEPKEKPECLEENYSDEEWNIAIAQSAHLHKEFVGMAQYYGRYSIGLLYNQVRSYMHSFKSSKETGWDWYNKIGHFENGDLFLSALPIISKGTDSLKDMKKENIGAVLSVTEVFETQSEGMITSPIKPAVYAEHGIKHLQIPTPDCETIFIERVLRGVEFIHWCLSKGISIDVHCKAGRGRSFLIVVCYLIKYQQMTGREAFALVQKMRPQSGFNEERAEWKTIEIFEKFYLDRSPRKKIAS